MKPKYNLYQIQYLRNFLLYKKLEHYVYGCYRMYNFYLKWQIFNEMQGKITCDFVQCDICRVISFATVYLYLQ